MRDKVYIGDCRTVLPTLPEKSVQCCVTSPPYFGLRDYGHTDQIGLEQTPDEYVAQLVAVFREVRRVLRDDGTLWLNIGDSYASSRSNNGGYSEKSTLAGFTNANTKGRQASTNTNTRKIIHGLKEKDLIGIPWRVAFALQADGWYLRQDIIWHKPNPMPESVRDRCTKAHEYIFLLSKSPTYFYNLDAVKVPADYAGKSRGGSKQRYEQNAAGMDNKVYDTRNIRSVWTVGPAVFKGAHFATFPPSLIRPCVRAGCPVGGVVLDPFFGAGTTGIVAIEEGCKFIGVELNPDYVRRLLFQPFRVVLQAPLAVFPRRPPRQTEWVRQRVGLEPPRHHAADVDERAARGVADVDDLDADHDPSGGSGPTYRE